MESEILKLFLEEPRKVTLLGIKLFKGLLSLIISSKIFIYFFGRYDFQDVGDFSEWFDLLINGRVLLALLIFYAVNFILFNFIVALLQLPINSIRKKIINSGISVNSQQGLLKGFLVGLNYGSILKINFETNEVQAGDNIDALEVFLNEPTDSNIFNNSLVDELYSLSFIFIISYLLFFPIELFVGWFLVFCVILFFSIFIIYLSISLTGIYISRNKLKLTEAVKILKIRKKVFEFFSEKKIQLISIEGENLIEPGRLFNFKGKDFVLRLFYDLEPIKKEAMTFFIDDAIKREKKLLAIVNGSLDEEVKELIDQHKNTVNIIDYNEGVELEEGIRKFLR